MSDTRPNILLIMADDLGFSDLGCYGGEIETPNLDRLAANGLRFTQFYNNAVCAPTRASLLTGLYPQQVGGTGASLDTTGNVTIAEVLREARYRTLMAGKWHNGPRPHQIPVRRGFDRYWGLLSGCSNYFNPGEPRDGAPDPAHKKPGDMRPWGDDDRIMLPFNPDDPDFYTTDAFTEHALQFLDEYGGDDQPFLLYLAHCAPHFPLQAHPEDIAKYRGRYREGWDAIRRRRYQRQLELGIADPRWGLSATDERAPRFEDAGDADYWDLTMAVYAAMVDCMDRGIGRVLDKIRELGKEDNTLVIFLSDNGACAGALHATPGVPPGPVKSYHGTDLSWANASNTPFRLFKTFDHEGGICTPMIVSWPEKIDRRGETVNSPGHVLDFMPTFAELANAAYPDEVDGCAIPPMEGRSLVPILEGSTDGAPRTLFWENYGSRAVRHGRWKLVWEGPPGDHGGTPVPAGRDRWELYDIEGDRCELNDLSHTHPEIARDLAQRFDNWMQRCAGET